MQRIEGELNLDRLCFWSAAGSLSPASVLTPGGPGPCMYKIDRRNYRAPDGQLCTYVVRFFKKNKIRSTIISFKKKSNYTARHYHVIQEGKKVIIHHEPYVHFVHWPHRVYLTPTISDVYPPLSLGREDMLFYLLPPSQKEWRFRIQNLSQKEWRFA
jgi:hypothetical protein